MKQWLLSSAPRKSFPKVLALMVHDVFSKNSFLRHSGHPPCSIYHWSYPWMILYDISMNSSVLLWTSKCLWCSLSMIYLWTVLWSSSYSWCPVWAMNSSVLFKRSWYHKCFALSWSGACEESSALTLAYWNTSMCVWHFFRIVGPPIQYNPHRACLLFVIDQSLMCNSLNEGTQYPNS